MKLEIVDAELYEKICGKYRYFYNSMQFHQLNQNKCDEIRYLIFSTRKKKLALVIGIKESEICVPYSSPFGIFEYLQKKIKIEELEMAMDLLEDYAREKGIKKILFRLPPSFYDETFICKFENVLLRRDYHMLYCDLNYQFFIQDMVSYENSLFRNARKNLKNAILHNFLFTCCATEEEKKRAYDVIAINRKRKGYPLRMTYDQIKSTILLTEHDFFLLKKEETDVAAAIVFRVSEKYYQVIYWGDIDGFEEERPMNYLAYQMYQYYVDKGAAVLDIGPSTEEGIPNYGLCDFKESIGCEISRKVTYVKNI